MINKKDCLIATSGCGGGNGGPRGIYHSLQPYLNDQNIVVWSVDTIPNSVDKNVRFITELVMEHLNDYRYFYIAGWSMGGATAIQAAHNINNTLGLKCVKGVILFATQSAKAQNIVHLNVPIIWYHGKKDSCLRHQISVSMHEKYRYKKKITLFNNLDHGFTDNLDDFAKIIADDIKEVFCPLNIQEEISESNVEKFNILEWIKKISAIVTDKFTKI